MPFMARLFVLAAVTVLMAGVAHAHKPSDSYLTITSDGDQHHVQWDIALRDLELAVGLDMNRDGAITWGELKARREVIAAYALGRLRIDNTAGACTTELDHLMVDRHSDGAYAALVIVIDCPAAAGGLDVHYSLLFDLDPTHRGLLRYIADGVTTTYVLSPEDPRVTLQPGKANAWGTFVAYLVEGVWHIWIGFDHILFLLTLLLPAVLVHRDRRRRSMGGFAAATLDVLKIVTAFTVAHSITLALAVLEIVSLPARLVESTIAFSVLIAAVNNLRPMVGEGRWGSRWLLAFVFGLVHGFGFANVLVDLGLAHGALAASLFGFNAGVEVGQIAIVAAFFPLAWLIRESAFYRIGIVGGGSAIAACIAAIWMLERIGGYEVPGFWQESRGVNATARDA